MATIHLKFIRQQSKASLFILLYFDQQKASLLSAEQPKSSLVSKEQDPSASPKVLPPPTFQVHNDNFFVTTLPFFYAQTINFLQILQLWPSGEHNLNSSNWMRREIGLSCEEEGGRAIAEGRKEQKWNSKIGN